MVQIISFNDSLIKSLNSKKWFLLKKTNWHAKYWVIKFILILKNLKETYNLQTSIYIYMGQNWEKIQLDFKLDSNYCLILGHVSYLSFYLFIYFFNFCFGWVNVLQKMKSLIYINHKKPNKKRKIKSKLIRISKNN